MSMTDIDTPIQVVERIYWTVPSHYSSGEEFGTFEEAVAAARAGQVEFTYPGQGENGGDLVTRSRACVALRQSCRYAPQTGVGTGNDCEILRWEVYPDRVALVPEGQGGLTDEQATDVANAKASSKGWA